MASVSLGQLDPMPTLRAAAVDKVNGWYNDRARESLQRDQAHAEKRTIAAAVAADPSRATAEFSSEADLRGITPTALASLVMAKPNETAQRELGRQRTMLAIATATTPDALAAVLANVTIC